MSVVLGEEWFVNGLEPFGRPVTVGTDHDFFGCEEVLDGCSLAQELGIGREADPPRRVAHCVEQCGADLLDRGRRDRTLDDHEVIIVGSGECLAGHLRGRGQRRGVNAAVLARGRLDREEGHVSLGNSLVAGRRFEICTSMLRDEVVEPRFVDRGLSIVQRCDDLLIDIDRQYIVAEIGETGGESGSDVSASDDVDLHGYSVLVQVVDGCE